MYLHSMSKFHITSSQWGLISGIRQLQSDMIVVHAPRSPFAPEARKGQLMLVVEAEGDVTCGRQACGLVARTISETFYADGSMSITASLRSALKAANAALYQHNFNSPAHKRASVGVTCVVIHGSDLFVTQAPPAQAFLAHAAKLRALPIPPSWTRGADTAGVNQQGALGTSLGSEPAFSRAVLQPGDTLVLCSSNVARLLGKQQAEQLICFSDATTIAEELYGLCRAANLPEAHTIVLEAVPGPAPALDVVPPTVPAPVKAESAPSKLSPRFGGWLGRSQRVRSAEPGVAASVETATGAGPAAQAVMDAPTVPATVRSSAAQPLAGTGQGLFEMVPVADTLPLPPSAFIGEGEYGGTVRPPAVPKRNRQIDLSDNYGTPVDFAALPRKATPPPPTIGERLTLPLRAGMATLLGGVANVPRRTSRSVANQPAQGLRLKGLSYRKQRPPLPWFNMLLILGVVAALVVVGLQQNRQRDTDTVTQALDQVDTAVREARRASDDQVARQQLAVAETALNEDVQSLVQSGLITETRPVIWSRYLQVRTSYDRAMATVNRIGFVDDLRPVAALPGRQGLIERLVLGTTGAISDTNPSLYYVDKAAGVLYEQGRDGPILRPDQEVAGFTTRPVRDALWRDGNIIIALDRGDVLFPIYTVYFRNGDSWLASQLNQTELMEPADRDLPMATFAGNLYMWDRKTAQLWKYANGFYGDRPTPWITNAGSVPLGQVVDVQVDGRIYLLNSDASIVVFEGGQLVQQFAAPTLTDPISTVARFIVTPDVLSADGLTVERPGHIYILDTANERVLQLNKADGTLIQQIRARTRGPLNQLSDLAVDEARALLYLANGAQVLQVPLPEPPQFTPEESATATPEP